ncbi:MAG: D-tyrosyl-tRNA(Tyr) deacylase [Rhodothermales bacterium]|nr:D-tyrosyl-tRNA(Tyr) deacylase [Rhodothermales bacterium]
MKALVQRVKRASVTVDGAVVGQIGPGMLILFGVHKSDTEDELQWLVRKCAALRIFPDDDMKMNRSIMDVRGEILVVSQFTLYGSVERGNRPSFEQSGRPELAEPLYNQFVEMLAEISGVPVQTGVFGAMMDVELVNDGPVTLSIERTGGGR